MKVENMLKLKEEFDYQTLSKKLQMDVDRLTSDNERLRKGMLVVESEMQRKVAQAHLCTKGGLVLHSLFACIFASLLS